MAYTPFANDTPDPSSENGTQAFDSTRENLLAIRDSIILMGFFPGWDCQAQDTGGSTPPTTPETPDEFLYSRGTERVKIACTWGTSGVTDDCMLTAIFSYSSDSGSNYDLIADTDFTAGTVTLTYDASGNYISHAWS